MKWKYDKKFKQWYATNNEQFVSDRFTIEKKDKFYYLEHGYKFISGFYKLKSAKTVAELIAKG
jgi:hypothetical protein